LLGDVLSETGQFRLESGSVKDLAIDDVLGHLSASGSQHPLCHWEGAARPRDLVAEHPKP
jgi:hypothetical protein